MPPLTHFGPQLQFLFDIIRPVLLRETTIFSLTKQPTTTNNSSNIRNKNNHSSNHSSHHSSHHSNSTISSSSQTNTMSNSQQQQQYQQGRTLPESVRWAVEAFVRYQTMEGSLDTMDVYRCIREQADLLYERQMLYNAIDSDPFRQFQDIATTKLPHIKNRMDVTSCSRIMTWEGYALIQSSIHFARPVNNNIATTNTPSSSAVPSFSLHFRYERQPSQNKVWYSIDLTAEAAITATIPTTNASSSLSSIPIAFQPPPPTRRLLEIEVWTVGSRGPSVLPAQPIEIDDDDDDEEEEEEEEEESDDDDVKVNGHGQTITQVKVDTNAHGKKDGNDDKKKINHGHDGTNGQKNDNLVKTKAGNETNSSSNNSNQTKKKSPNKSNDQKVSSTSQTILTTKRPPNDDSDEDHDDDDDMQMDADHDNNDGEQPLEEESLCDRYAAFLDPDVLSDFMEWTQLQGIPDVTAFFFLMTFPYYESEWDLIGMVLESAFDDDDDDDDEEHENGSDEEEDDDDDEKVEPDSIKKKKSAINHDDDDDEEWDDEEEE